MTPMHVVLRWAHIFAEPRQRHGWRDDLVHGCHGVDMCLAMFMATSSLFLGQPQVFPMAVRHSDVLPVPVMLVVAAFLYWLVRIRVWPRLRRTRTRRAAAATGTLGAV